MFYPCVNIHSMIYLSLCDIWNALLTARWKHSLWNHFSPVLSLWRPSVCVVRAEVGRAASLCGRQVMADGCKTTAVQTVMLTPSTTLPSAPSLKWGSPPSSASPAPVWWPSLSQGPAWEAHYLWLLCVYHLTHLTTVFIINEVLYVCACASSPALWLLWAVRSLLKSSHWCDIYRGLPNDLGDCWAHTHTHTLTRMQTQKQTSVNWR